MKPRKKKSDLALFVGVLVIIIASFQSMAEQLSWSDNPQGCGHCQHALGENGVIPPLVVALSSLLLDVNPQALTAAQPALKGMESAHPDRH